MTSKSAMIARVAEKERIIMAMSNLTGTSPTVCADIITNYAQENDISFAESARQLRKAIKIGKEKSRGKHKGRSKGT